MPSITRRTFLGSAGAVTGGVVTTRLELAASTQQAGPEQPAPAKRTIVLTRKALPVLRTGDVAVVGGSFAGIAAALFLARAKRKIILVEPRTYLGREMTATLRPWISDHQSLPPWIDACRGAHNPPQYPNPSGDKNTISESYQHTPDEIALKPDKVKLTLENLMLEAGVDLVYASIPVGLCRIGGSLAGLIVGNKSSRQVIRCSMIIDTTETALVARLAGAEFEPFSDAGAKFRRTLEFTGVEGLARDATELEVPAACGLTNNKVTLHRGYRGPDHLLVECELPLGVRECTVTDSMRREIEARRRCMTLAAHLTSNVPSFAKAFLAATSYELSGAHTSRMKGADPQWASGTGDLKISEDGQSSLVSLGALAGPLKGLWCLQEAARIESGRLRYFQDPVLAARVGEAFGREAVAKWSSMAAAPAPADAAGSVADAAAVTAQPLEVKEQEIPQRGRHYEQWTISPAEVPVCRDVDVLVVGGGTSGATAAATAGREGMKTLVLEMNPGLGGTGTIGAVDSYWFGRRVAFAARVTERVRKVHESIHYNPGGGNTPKWNIEAKMYALLQEAEEAKAEIMFNTLVTGAVVEGHRVRGVIMATRFGPQAVLSKVVIDATGDGDVAAFAGAQYVYCSAMDHIGMSHAFAQFTNPGRNTNHFTSSVDVSNIEDYNRAILASRRRGNNTHDHGVYVASRETRHILGDKVITATDSFRQRAWPDAVSIHYSNNDMKGKTCSQWSNSGLIPPNMETEIPYRALIPKGLDNIIVAGKAYSATHDIIAAIRMQADLETLGGVVALAAAQAVKEKQSPRWIDVADLQRRLAQEGVLPRNFPARKLVPAKYSDAELKTIIRLMINDKPLLSYQNMEMFEVFRGRIPFVEVGTAGPRVVPMLEEALQATTGDQRVVLAQALALYGSRAGVPVLIEKIGHLLQGLTKVPLMRTDIRHAGYPPNQGGMPDVCYLMYSLGRTGDARAIPVFQRVADILDPKEEDYRHRWQSTFTYVDAICYGAERIGDRAAIPVLKQMHSYPALCNQIDHAFQPDYFKERQATNELSIGKALSRCGSTEGIALVIEYLDDSRTLLAEQAHSHLIRISGRDHGKDAGGWKEWLRRIEDSWQPKPLTLDLDEFYEEEIMIRGEAQT